MKIKAIIAETREKEFEIEVDNLGTAFETVRNMYNNGELKVTNEENDDNIFCVFGSIDDGENYHEIY